MSNESQVTATASAVTSKELTAKSSGRSFILYTVETDKGEFTTAKRALAEKAHRVINRAALYTVKTEQRGEFTNYYLEAVDEATSSSAGSPTGGSTGSPFDDTEPSFNSPDMSGGRALPLETTASPVGNHFPTGSNTKFPSTGEPTDKDVFIFRQTAAKVAGQISRTPEEFWSNLDEIVAYFVNGAKPAAFAPVAPAIPEDDDIPF